MCITFKKKTNKKLFCMQILKLLNGKTICHVCNFLCVYLFPLDFYSILQTTATSLTAMPLGLLVNLI